MKKEQLTKTASHQRSFSGVVTSTAMAKTIVVRVDRTIVHPKYQKRYVRSRKYKVHAEDTSKFHVGDRVAFVECRPLSADKRWRVVS